MPSDASWGRSIPVPSRRFTPLAILRRARGKPAEAEPLFEELLATRRRVQGAEHPEVARTLVDLGRTELELGKFAEAEARLRDGPAILEKTRPDQWERFHALVLIGEAARRPAEVRRGRAVAPLWL